MPFGIRALFFVYSFSIEVIVWLALVPAVWMRALVTRADSVELRQRLARAPQCDAAKRPGTGPVLVHAVSVGEMHAAAPLVAALAAEGRRVWLTAGTAAGLEAGRRLARAQSAVDAVAYLPWDRLAVRGWLSRIAPSAVVVMETEIWPNLFRACADLQVPIFIANGRVRPADVPRYRLARPFFARVLESAAWIGVQSPGERERFLAIGAPAGRLDVAGNLKFDAALAACDEPTERFSFVWRPASAGLRAGPPEGGHHTQMKKAERPLVVAGSTHAPEEQWLLECARLLDGQGRPIRLVLAPRNVARAGRIAQLARSRRLRVRLWSEPSSAAWDVMVLDRYATLRACYAGADVVVIGGTFAPVGGHNILEPAALSRPILIGPHTEEIAALVQQFTEAGALVRLSGAEPGRALADSCHALLADRDLARAIGERAGALCRQGAGSAARHAGVIVEQLAAAG